MSLRYSIYKVQTSPFALASQLIYSSTLKLICQELFSSFFKFLRGVSIACCSLSNFAMLAHPKSFVKNFFQVFANFFWICYSFDAAQKRPAYISTQATICQALFFDFFNFLSGSFYPPDADTYPGFSGSSVVCAELPYSPVQALNSISPDTAEMPGAGSGSQSQSPLPRSPAAFPAPRLRTATPLPHPPDHDSAVQTRRCPSRLLRSEP